jgi:hypothetical protein
VQAFRKYCLLNGFDDIGLTLRHKDKIKAFEARAPGAPSPGWPHAPGLRAVRAFGLLRGLLAAGLLAAHDLANAGGGRRLSAFLGGQGLVTLQQFKSFETRWT